MEKSTCLKVFNSTGSLHKSKTAKFSQTEISFGNSTNIKFEMVAYNKRAKHIPYVKISQETEDKKSGLLFNPLTPVTKTDFPLYNSRAIAVGKLTVFTNKSKNARKTLTLTHAFFPLGRMRKTYLLHVH